jgi:hypothetical protein
MWRAVNPDSHLVSEFFQAQVKWKSAAFFLWFFHHHERRPKTEWKFSWHFKMLFGTSCETAPGFIALLPSRKTKTEITQPKDKFFSSVGGESRDIFFSQPGLFWVETENNFIQKPPPAAKKWARRHAWLFRERWKNEAAPEET